MRAWLHLAALAAVVAALGAWLYYRPAGPGADETYALSQIKAAEVQRMKLERLASETSEASGESGGASAAAIELEKRDGVWRIVAPFAARADSFQAQRFLAIVEARSAARFPAANLDRYGLDPPQGRITLDDQGFAIGGVNTSTREQYVLTNGAVYAIPLAQRTAIPREADALIARALFAPDEVPVRLELPDLTAALEDGNWKLTPAPADAGPDERNAWAQRWREALAVRAARHAGKTPEAFMKVELKDGRKLALGIASREPELVLTREDEGIQYHFFADAAKRLLSAPGGAAADTEKK